MAAPEWTEGIDLEDLIKTIAQVLAEQQELSDKKLFSEALHPFTTSVEKLINNMGKMEARLDLVILPSLTEMTIRLNNLTNRVDALEKEKGHNE